MTDSKKPTAALKEFFDIVGLVSGVSPERIIAAAGKPKAEREIFHEIHLNARRDSKSLTMEDALSLSGEARTKKRTPRDIALEIQSRNNGK